MSNVISERAMQAAYEEIESLRQQLENMTERYNVRKELGDHLAQQLAEKDAEIERLKAAIPDKTKRNRECVTLEDWRRAALYYESQWSNCSYGYNKAIGDLHNQLAAGQAREQQQLREALESVIDQCECDINPGRNDARDALVLPQDTASLEAMIAKAGEVMRERCLSEIAPTYYSHELAKHIVEGCCYDLRALPGVTLEDLK